MWAQRESPGLKVLEKALLSAWTVWASKVPRGQRETWAWWLKRNIRALPELKVNNKRDVLIHTASHYQRSTGWEPAKWPRLMMLLCSYTTNTSSYILCLWYSLCYYVSTKLLLHNDSPTFADTESLKLLNLLVDKGITVWYFCCYLIFVVSNVKLNALNVRFKFKLFCLFFLCSMKCSFYVLFMLTLLSMCP